VDSWKRYKYKNLTFLSISFLVAFFFFENETIHSFLLHLGALEYLGAFLAGIMFTSTFTVALSMVILLILAENLNPIHIGIIAGVGAVLGDLLIFRFVRDNLYNEIKDVYNNFGGNHLRRVLHTKYFSWTLPVIGAALIASPLPDEIGISLMGIAKMKTYQFVILSFLLNSVGIFLVISASAIVKP